MLIITDFGGGINLLPISVINIVSEYVVPGVFYLAMNDITLAIKTFERPLALKRLITSIRKFYPTTHIMVADDSKTAITLEDPNLRYLRLPFDTGLAEGRNILVQQTKTPYIVILEDDFIFTPRTDLSKLQGILATSDIDLLGGRVITDSKPFEFGGYIVREGDKVSCTKSKPREVIQGCGIYDFIANFFMAKTDKLKTVKWDPDLKLSEHTFFFVNAMGKVKVGFCPAVSIEHRHDLNNGDYMKYRMRAKKLIKTALLNNGVTEYRTVTGGTIKLENLL